MFWMREKGFISFIEIEREREEEEFKAQYMAIYLKLKKNKLNQLVRCLIYKKIKGDRRLIILRNLFFLLISTAASK